MIFLREESPNQYLSSYPITSVIVIINVLVFIYTTINGGLTNSAYLYKLGGNSQSQFLDGEYYRIVSYAFIHNGFTHFLLNMGYILILCPPLERSLNKIQYILLFISSVIGGGLLIILLNSNGAVGASGFGYAIFGVYFSLIFFRRKVIDRESRNAVLLIMGVGFAFTFTIENISIAGHFGGFIIGLLFGLLFTRNVKSL